MNTYDLAKNSIFTSDSNGGSISSRHLLGSVLKKSTKLKVTLKDISDCLILFCRLDFFSCMNSVLFLPGKLLALVSSASRSFTQ